MYILMLNVNETNQRNWDDRSAST